MNPPFTTEQFFEIIAQYNQAIWPMQLGLNLLALIAIGLLIWRRPYSGRSIPTILALLWAWAGIAYHLFYFTTINKAAFAFGVVCLAGAGAFLWAGVIKARMEFTSTVKTRRVLSIILVAFSLVVYPVLSAPLGHGYPIMPTFGLPCPTTIFTIGVLCFLATPHPRYVLLTPILWSVVGTQAAFLFGVHQDLARISHQGAR
jgi:multidrug transporter EmrE-like cation transporter